MKVTLPFLHKHLAAVLKFFGVGMQRASHMGSLLVLYIGALLPGTNVPAVYMQL